MDLWRRRLPGHANAVWNGYLAEAGGYSGICLLPLFLSCRAAVRAKTSATAARLQSEPGAKSDLERTSREYLAMAHQFLNPAPPAVVAIGGFSGSGKTSLALALAAGVGAAPGAVVLRSDELRKRICGVSPLQRLGAEGYSAKVSQRVYAALLTQAAAVVRTGFSVIADAVFARPADREGIEQTARDLGVPFAGLWLEAPEPVLIARLQHRMADASDADADVLRNQCAQGAGTVSWQRIDAQASANAVLEQAASVVNTAVGRR
jgi:predicted kinase